MAKAVSNDAQQLLKRLKEIVFILAIALSCFLVVAFYSYDPLDPGWSKTAQHSEISNLIGYVGAWVADLFLYLFGGLAYLFPAALIYLSSLLLRLTEHSWSLWSLRLSGFIVVLFTGSGLLALHFDQTSTLPVAWGGAFGSGLSLYLTTFIGLWGSTMLFVPFLLIGSTMVTGISWPKLSKTSSVAIVKGVQYTMQYSMVALAYVYSSVKSYQKQHKKHGAIRTPVKLRKIPKRQPAAKPALQKVVLPKPTKQIKTTTKPGLPDLALLETSADDGNYCVANIEQLSKEVETKLADFGINVTVTAVYPGPVITRIEMQLAPGTKASRITTLSKDLARSLSVTSVRVVEVIAGKSVVGLEIPNQQRALVRLRDLLSSEQYHNSNSPLTLVLGKDIAGNPVAADLTKMPHLLVAGTTGSGKSVGVNAMLLSMLYKSSVDDLRLILIDPKMLELSIYEGIPHLLTPVVTDMKDAANVLSWCVYEMERRYKLMAAIGVRNVVNFNYKIQVAEKAGKPLCDPFIKDEVTHLTKLPYIVVIIDEFADMIMVVGKKVEELIARIAQKARAAGIHMILATQRPSVDVITGLIKANVPTRIAFQVSSRIDSRTILDQQGAEQLLGHGDMLYLAPGAGLPTRIHGAFVSDEEVHKVVAHLKSSNPEPNYIEEPTKAAQLSFDEASGDDLYEQAVQIVAATRKASISYLQRRLKIGFNRAARLVEEMQAAGVVSEVQSNGSREVLIAPSES